MKKIEEISTGSNYVASAIGKFDGLGEFVFKHPMGIEMPGRVFLRDDLSLTGSEVSFQMMPAGSSSGFLHTHKKNEELYVVIKGEGEFQVDGAVFPIAEGSVVRISPAGKRSYRNSGKQPMAMMCIQCKAGSLEEVTFDDGVMLDEAVVW